MSKEDTSQLATHIGEALVTSQVALNNALVTQTRTRLLNLSTFDLGELILKTTDANNQDSPISLGTNSGNPPIFVSKAISNHIPNMYTATYFQKIIDSEIATAASEALKGNWVLGEIETDENPARSEDLATQLHNQYLANYVDIWESLIANIHPYTPKNLAQTDAMINTLTSNNSPLLQLLQTIKQNTDFAPFTTTSPKLSALNHLLNTTDSEQQISLYPIFISLQHLHTYLDSIINSQDPNKNALAYASARMQNTTQDPITQTRNLAEQSPEPLKTWLNTITDESWDFMLQQASVDIEKNWSTSISPTYKTQIANLYPFNPNTNQEVNLQQFSNFLGKQGTLALFYQHYLKPFINEDKQWQWKSVDNRRIPLSNDVLGKFQTLALLQQAFFPNGDNKIFVEFSLQPMTVLEPTSKAFTLKINGQLLSYQKTSPAVPHNFSWPGNYGAGETTVNFIMSNNTVVTENQKSDWAWFRMASNSIEQIRSNKELVLDFKVKDHRAKYLMVTNSALNLFLPANLSKMDLPENLLTSAQPLEG